MTGYAAEGKSLARQDGKVIFSEGAVPGDVVDVFVSTNKKDYGEGRATHFHEYSTERTAPFCQHFGTCGGCKWQMLPYQKQLEYKQQEVAQNFRRIGKVELPEMMTIVGADNSIHYRNKLEFTFSNKRYLTAEEIKTLPPPAHLLKKRAENEIDSSQIDANQDIESKNINNNNTGDYSDYGAAEEDKATTQVTDYSDYGAAEENNDAAPTTSNAKTPTDNTKIPMATNSLTTLTKIELDIMQQNNPLVYKTAFDKLGAVEQKIVTDKLAAK